MEIFNRLKKAWNKKLEIWSEEMDEWKSWKRQVNSEKVWKEEILTWKLCRWLESLSSGATAIIFYLILILVIFPIMGLIFLIISWPIRWILDKLLS